MDQEEPSANIQRSNAENDRDEVIVPVHDVSSFEKSPDIFVSDVECFEDVGACVAVDYVPDSFASSVDCFEDVAACVAVDYVPDSFVSSVDCFEDVGACVAVDYVPDFEQLPASLVSNDECIEEDAGQVVIDPVPNLQQTADIFKLNFDCFEHLFDYLSMADLVSVGGTCKQLQKMAGQCFRRTYPNITTRLNRYRIEISGGMRSLDVTQFAEFIRQIEIKATVGEQPFRKILSKLLRIEEMEIGMVFAAEAMVRMKECFGKLGVLRIKYCFFRYNFKLQTILRNCPKLKRLEICRCHIDYEWLTRRYPQLEYLKFMTRSVELGSVATFLGLNPNIRKFATSDEILWENRDALKTNGNIKLDDLAIESFYLKFVSLCHLLNELHANGFYQRLQLYIKISHPDMFDQLATLNGLIKLDCSNSAASLSALTNLEHFCLPISGLMTDVENAAIHLVNLKSIQFQSAWFDDIMPFIKRSVALQTINVSSLQNGLYFNESTRIIDLVALNRERQKLADARKITLYVQERIYLATKWALKETNFDSICMKRIQSFDRGNNDF